MIVLSIRAGCEGCRSVFGLRSFAPAFGHACRASGKLVAPPIVSIPDFRDFEASRRSSPIRSASSCRSSSHQRLLSSAAICRSSKRMRIARAGLPATISYGPTSFVTTLPAPITAPLPIRDTPGRMIAFAPIQTSWPISRGGLSSMSFATYPMAGLYRIG